MQEEKPARHIIISTLIGYVCTDKPLTADNLFIETGSIVCTVPDNE